MQMDMVVDDRMVMMALIQTMKMGNERMKMGKERMMMMQMMMACKMLLEAFSFLMLRKEVKGQVKMMLLIR